MESYNILIVDDDYQNLQLLHAYLNAIDPNFTIIKTNRSKKAFKLAKTRMPDLIITDWEMPALNGLDLIKILKKDIETKEIPVIMLTGIMLAAENLKLAFDAGAIDFISKPVRKNELSARVNSILKLSDSYKEIKKLNATKDKFFSIIAHDLIGPFNSLIGLSEMLFQDAESFSQDKIKETAKLLKDATTQNYKLLHNLLQWSRSQQGTVPFKPEKISLNEIFNQIVLKYKTTSTYKNISLHMPLETDLYVLADKTMLISILDNLINNAFKYTNEKGSISVKTKEVNGFVEFVVSDNGIGISSKDINKIFRLDTKLSTLGTKKEQGTGLGLILCKEFVEKHTGKIWVESKEKKGTDFYFTIPAA